MKEELNIIPERMEKDFRILETFTDPDEPWSRRAFSKEYSEARIWLAKQFESAGLHVYNDAASNLIGRRDGSANQILMLGSHIDTVKAGGRFDGIVGVLGALEVARCLKDSNVDLSFPLEIVDFTCEEPTIGGLTPLGSRIMSGELGHKDIKEAVTPFGKSLLKAIDSLNGNSTNLSTAKRLPGQIAGYLELHIEQGSVLEKSGLAAGIVTVIAAPNRGSIQFEGVADHAGATPMNERKDALIGAAEFIVKLEEIVTTNGIANENVGTVGSLTVTPNMINIIPGKVDMTLEVRSTDLESLAILRRVIQEEAERIASERNLSHSLNWDHIDEPVHLPQSMQSNISDAFEDLDFPTHYLPSRASHDAARLASITPVGMVFIRCLAGKSHCPEEFASLEDIVSGTRLLGQSLIRLDRKLMK